MSVCVRVCHKVLLTLGPKEWEFRGGPDPPRLQARDETDEKVKMNNSSQVLQDHVRLLLSGGNFQEFWDYCQAL